MTKFSYAGNLKQTLNGEVLWKSRKQCHNSKHKSYKGYKALKYNEETGTSYVLPHVNCGLPVVCVL